MMAHPVRRPCGLWHELSGRERRQKLAKDNSDGSCTDDVDPKLNGQPGGYKDGAGTPSDVLPMAAENG